MEVKLIPVVEIGYNNQGVPAPGKYPYWKHPDLWDAYHKASYLKAGFTDAFVPYLRGSSFYELTDITEDNLIRIIKDHVGEAVNGRYNLDQVCALSGGFVLNIDNEDAYFPQCCGDLSDIGYWNKLLDGNVSFYAGHPEPGIKIAGSDIVFDFDTDGCGERFSPTPLYMKLAIDKADLKKAVAEARLKLHGFETRIKAINIKAQLNIPEIEKLLIWGDD